MESVVLNGVIGFSKFSLVWETDPNSWKIWDKYFKVWGLRLGLGLGLRVTNTKLGRSSTVVPISVKSVPFPGNLQTFSQVGVFSIPLELSLNLGRITVDLSIITRPPVKISHIDVHTCRCFACFYKFLDWTPCCTIGRMMIHTTHKALERAIVEQKHVKNP